jgi:hypothetical protein
MCPIEQQHADIRDKNMVTFQYLDKSKDTYMEWETTILFYAGLHCIDMFLATLSPPIHPNEHKERRKYVSQYLRTIAGDYEGLYQKSRWARYGDKNIDLKLRNESKNQYAHIRQISPY